jgi:predicted Na+-dependent transporter
MSATKTAAVRIKKIVAGATQLRNILFVLTAVAAGILVPDLEVYFEPLTIPIVSGLIYISIRGFGSNGYSFRPGITLLVATLVVSYLFIPAVGILLSRVMLTDGQWIGIAIMLAAPSTAGSAVIWTEMSGGNTDLSISLAFASILLAPLLMPILIVFLLGQSVSLPVTLVFQNIVLIVGLAILLTWALPANAIDDRILEWSSTLAIGVLIYTGLATSDFGHLAPMLLLKLVAATGTILGTAFAAVVLGGVVTNTGREDTLAVLYTSALKNLGIALVVAIPFADSDVVLAIIVYYVLQQIASAILADIALPSWGGRLIR